MLLHATDERRRIVEIRLAFAAARWPARHRFREIAQDQARTFGHRRIGAGPHRAG